MILPVVHCSYFQILYNIWSLLSRFLQVKHWSPVVSCGLHQYVLCSAQECTLSTAWKEHMPLILRHGTLRKPDKLTQPFSGLNVICTCNLHFVSVYKQSNQGWLPLNLLKRVAKLHLTEHIQFHGWWLVWMRRETVKKSTAASHQRKRAPPECFQHRTLCNHHLPCKCSYMDTDFLCPENINHCTINL